LFSKRFEEQLLDTIHEELSPIRHTQPFGPEYSHGQEQSNCWLNVEDHLSAERLRRWHVRVIWDGTAVVRHHVPADHEVPTDQLVEYAIKPAWVAAGRLVVGLGGYGPAHMALKLNRARSGPPRVDAPAIDFDLQRHLLQPEPGEAAIASLTRELLRTTGRVVYEEAEDDREEF
jgi:hypothetical protein